MANNVLTAIPNHFTTQLADSYHLRIALINALYGPIHEAVMMHY